LGGNHVDDTNGGAPIETGAARSIRNWPVWINLMTHTKNYILINKSACTALQYQKIFRHLKERGWQSIALNCIRLADSDLQTTCGDA